MSKTHLSRRQFMNRSLVSAGVAGGFAIGGTKSSGRVIGANDTVRIAVAGLNGRGGEHVSQWLKMKPGVEIACLVDPDTRTYKRRLTQIERHGGQAPADSAGHSSRSTISRLMPSRSPHRITGMR